MTRLAIILSILLTSTINKNNGNIRLIFEEEKSLRSSFCMYSDGRFYETRAEGCVGQIFRWGYWQRSNDTVDLQYESKNLYYFDIIKSRDTSSSYQVVKIIDCYNQPVRFQYVDFDTSYANLYNPGILRVKKGKYIGYANIFENGYDPNQFQKFNADTITYKWNCNRESIEAVSGGTLTPILVAETRKVIVSNKRVREI